MHVGPREEARKGRVGNKQRKTGQLHHKMHLRLCGNSTEATDVAIHVRYVKGEKHPKIISCFVNPEFKCDHVHSIATIAAET